ncbi:hypothetical protein MASR2M66_05250 [Chloroflexota bacterium]
MNTKPIERAEPIEDPNAMLEQALIEDYLIEKGYSREALKQLPAELVEKLMTEASRYASLKMEEVKARANLVKGLREDAASLEK